MVSRSRPQRPPSDQRDLVREVSAIRLFLEKHGQQWHRRTRTRLQLAQSFLKGVTFTLGSLAAVVIITPIIVWFLRNVAWPPLINNVISQIIHQIELVNRQSPPAAADQ